MFTGGFPFTYLTINVLSRSISVPVSNRYILMYCTVKICTFSQNPKFLHQQQKKGSINISMALCVKLRWSWSGAN